MPLPASAVRLWSFGMHRPGRAKRMRAPRKRARTGDETRCGERASAGPRLGASPPRGPASSGARLPVPDKSKIYSRGAGRCHDSQSEPRRSEDAPQTRQFGFDKYGKTRTRIVTLASHRLAGPSPGRCLLLVGARARCWCIRACYSSRGCID